jgi:EpsD family peptidyl-prolyl cis-trans isomerase
MSGIEVLTSRRCVIRSLVAAGAIAALAACSRDRAPPETQVAVRVNDGEISVHQIQTVLQRQPRLIATAGEAAASRVLDVLVDQELAAQAAKKQGLESDPNVIQMLQTVRRETLARAFQERVAAKVASPTSDEVDRYYEAHPELFAQRRIYLLQETAVEAAPPQLAGLGPLVSAAQSADDVAKLLRDAGLRHSSRPLGQAAEDLPALVLGAVSKANVGQSVLLGQPGGARIYTVLSLHKAPVDRRTATEAITNYLAGERRRQAVNEAMTTLRQSAQVEYFGAFAPRPGASAPTGPGGASAPVPQ